MARIQQSRSGRSKAKAKSICGDEIPTRRQAKEAMAGFFSKREMKTVAFNSYPSSDLKRKKP
jgi:hypothetical protein